MSFASEVSATENGQSGVFKHVLFSGKAGEYFGIWLANLFLSIITLGIYSAWAKVRRISYFYGNTNIGGSPLLYHATGGVILRGRIIALVVLVIYQLALTFAPYVGLVMALAFIFVFPWVINSSLRFQARMMSWRNVRFSWSGTYWRTFFFMIIGPIIGILSVGILAPLISKHYYRYFATEHKLGNQYFQADLSTGAFYKIFLLGVVLPAIPFVVAGYFLFQNTMLGFATIFVLLVYGYIFFSAMVYQTLARNILVNGLRLRDTARFRSNLKVGRVIWISLSNIVVVLCTIGLMLPWASIRLYRYFCDNTQYAVTGDINAIFDRKQADASAFGEEFAEFEGLEFGV